MRDDNQLAVYGLALNARLGVEDACSFAVTKHISRIFRRALLLAAMSGLALSGDAAAQKLSLRIDHGVVTLDAENVTVDEVLARWTATTGLNIVSKSGQGSDVPVSVRLDGVTEREALSAVLRDVSGYIMGERRDTLTGIVTVDRLVILPQSAGHAPSPTVPEFVPPATESVDRTPRELAPVPMPGEEWSQP